MPASSQSPPPTRRRSSASPSPAAGVKGVTRKVIRTLEGLGHAMEADADDEAEDEEVAAALKADSRAGKPSTRPSVGGIFFFVVFLAERESNAGFITLGLYLTPSMSPRTVTLVLWSALAVIAPTDVVRLRVPAVERVYERCLGFLMRESERTGTNGTLWYMLGVNFALTFYPIDVATVAILICVWLLIFFPFLPFAPLSPSRPTFPVAPARRHAAPVLRSCICAIRRFPFVPPASSLRALRPPIGPALGRCASVHVVCHPRFPFSPDRSTRCTFSAA
ncbi:hypothetical protein DFH06DRAFT_1487825 [Mycena polygramma]|nr:hypothetical protein DFH06DRAFT_1487825 [Mycena polygramma]